MFGGKSTSPGFSSFCTFGFAPSVAPAVICCSRLAPIDSWSVQARQVRLKTRSRTLTYLSPVGGLVAGCLVYRLTRLSPGAGFAVWFAAPASPGTPTFGPAPSFGRARSSINSPNPS
jgi:hypothetical protein